MTDPDAPAGPEDPEAAREAWTYPREWVADVLASDGGVVHLRPIVPDDAERIVRFHEGLSERTRYMRYFGPTPTLPPREVARMTTVDYQQRVALVAVLASEIIAIGLYEGLAADGKPESAEVAFVVADDHQGRGLGPILLEHLAGAAAENGFTRFEAEVLSENPNMVAVFRDAGYQITRSFDGSVVHVEFLIDPTEALLSVRNSRERASEARSVANLLRPGSVAVIGASRDPHKVGNVLLQNILASGFTGPVFPINWPGHGEEDDADEAGENEAPANDFQAAVAAARKPKTPASRRERVSPPSVCGIRAYPTVRDVPDPVDLAVVAVPAARMDEVLDDCLAKGVRTLVVVSAGFGETGEEGLASERRLVAQVREHGMRLVGPNALGVVNNAPEIGINATLAPRIPEHGRVGFFCQSGALGIAILDTAAKRRLGLSTFVSAGNRADVSGNDLLQYWDTDPNTDVVLLYLESFGNPTKFSRIARRVSHSKPIVAVKSGRGAMSAVRAERSPEAVLDDRIARMVLEQAGVIQVESIADLFDTATVLAYQPLPAGPRTAVIGNSSVIASLAAYTARGYGLEIASTVDLGPSASVEAMEGALAAALADDGVDGVIVVFVPPVAVDEQTYAAALMRAARDSAAAEPDPALGFRPAKPIVSNFLAGTGVPDELSHLGQDGLPTRGTIPTYPSPERAAAALGRSWRYAKWRSRPDLPPVRPEGIDPEAARTFVREALAPTAGTDAEAEGRVLDHLESARLLAWYGIEVVPFREVRTMHEASAAGRELGFPVAVKSGSSDWRGRLDREGARLDLPDATSVVTAFAELSELTGEDVLQVQQMAPRGAGVMIRLSDDPSFGSLISFGLSGRTFELLGDHSYRSVPLSEIDAVDLLSEPRAMGLLAGESGDSGVDEAALIDLVLRISAIATDLPEVREILLDPILCSEEGAAILNGQIRLGPVPTRMDTGPRKLG